MKRIFFNVFMTLCLLLSLLAFSTAPALAASNEANFTAFSVNNQSGTSTIETPKQKNWETISMNGGVSWNHFGPPLEPFANNWDIVFKEGNGDTVYENNVRWTSSDYFGGVRVISQSFSSLAAHTVNRVQLMLRRQGTIPGDMTVAIYTADASTGEPFGSALATGSISANSIGVGSLLSWYSISLGSGAPLTAGGRYAIVASVPGADSSYTINGNLVWYQASNVNPYPIDNISLNVMYGTDRADLVATYTTSPLTSVKIGNTTQTSGSTHNNFTGPVTYTVTAEDGTTQDWLVTVGIALNTEANFKTFALAGQTSSFINVAQSTVTVTVPWATNVNALVANFTSSDLVSSVTVGATPQISGSTANNFTNPVTYTITAEAGNTRDWIVTVVRDPPSTAADFLTYSLAGQTGSVIGNGVITVSVPFAADVTNLAASFTTSPLTTGVMVGSTAQVSGVTPNNFTDNVTYVIAAENTSVTRSWVVTISRDPPDTGAEMLTFSLPGQTGMTKVSDNATLGHINITVLYGTDLANLVATFTTSPLVASVRIGAADQTSGSTVNNFSSPVTYRVSSQNNAAYKDWVITVTKGPPSTDADFLTYSLPGQVGAANVKSYPGWLTTSNNGGASWTDVSSRTFDAQFIVSNNTTTLFENNRNGSATDYFAANTLKSQSFVAETSHSITRIQLLLSRQGNPSGNVIITLRTTDANTGRPTGVILGTGQLAASSITTGSAAWYTFTLNTSVDLVAGTRYAICMSAPGGDITTNRIWYSVGTNNPYPTGKIDVTVAYGTNLNALVATFTTSPYINSNRIGPTNQISGNTPNNFTGPVTYAITAENTTFIRSWIVTVSVTPNSAAEIVSYSVPGQKSVNINSAAGTINVLMPSSSNVTALIATFTASPDSQSVIVGTVNQQSGVTVNNFSSQVTYTVTAQNGATKNWLVTVSTAPGITSVSPNSGASTGGTSITITGINFTGATGATIGGAAITNFAVASDTQITGVTPGGASGARDVVVLGPGGSATMAGAFTFVDYGGGGGGIGGGGGGGAPSGQGTTSISIYTNYDGLFNLAASAKSDDALVTIDIAKGVLAKTKEATALKWIKIIPMATQPTSTSAAQFIGLAYEITPEGATFSPAITLTLKYDVTKLPKDIDLDSLTMALFNPVTGQWDPIQSEHNKANATVSALITHFSNYAIIGQIVTPKPTVTPTTTPPPTSTATPTPTTTPTQTPTTSPTVSPTPTKTTTPPPTTPPNNGSGTNWGLIIGIIAAVAVVVLVVILILRNRSRK